MAPTRTGAGELWIAYRLLFPRDDWSLRCHQCSITRGDYSVRFTGDGSRLDDRLGPVNDLLIALTARQMGAAVVTSHLQEFRLIATRVSGLRVVAPEDRVSWRRSDLKSRLGKLHVQPLAR